VDESYTTAIRLHGVTKQFDGASAPAVDALDLEVPTGSIVALIGPSGCGKTTTLRMINRLIEPTSGRIEINGVDALQQPAVELRRDIGYVIQQVGLFPHRTIAQNIATVPRTLGWDNDRIRERTAGLVELVGLDHAMLERYPDELSGGQQQRVGVARARAADPPVLLMDEPFGAVDPIVRARLQDQFLELQQRLRKTIVMVTHDIDEAIKLGDRIAILNVGGILEQYDTPETILREPANDFVADFLGRDRGLKRLALIPIRNVSLDPGPVVQETDSVDVARETMARHSVDWIGIASGEQLLGWVPAGELDGRSDLGDLPVRRFRSWLTLDSSLRDALDAVVSSHTNVAAVFGARNLGLACHRGDCDGGGRDFFPPAHLLAQRMAVVAP
jgi:osmoprotectant transport system ATP-binding protein